MHLFELKRTAAKVLGLLNYLPDHMQVKTLEVVPKCHQILMQAIVTGVENLTEL